MELAENRQLFSRLPPLEKGCRALFNFASVSERVMASFLKSHCRSDMKRNTQKHCFAQNGWFPHVNYWSGAINIRNLFSHTTLKKSVSNFPNVVWFFFYTLLKFDILNAGVTFH